LLRIKEQEKRLTLNEHDDDYIFCSSHSDTLFAARAVCGHAFSGRILEVRYKFIVCFLRAVNGRISKAQIWHSKSYV